MILLDYSQCESSEIRFRWKTDWITLQDSINLTDSTLNQLDVTVQMESNGSESSQIRDKGCPVWNHLMCCIMTESRNDLGPGGDWTEKRSECNILEMEWNVTESVGIAFISKVCWLVNWFVLKMHQNVCLILCTCVSLNAYLYECFLDLYESFLP